MRRPIFLLVLLAIVVVAGGCGAPATVHESREVGPSKVGRASAEVAHSRALAYRDTIELLQNECRDMADRREKYIADAVRYRRMASKARFDEGLTSWEQKAYYEMYLTIAADREEAAARYKELIQAYASRISIISNRYNRQEAAAIDFGNMKMAAPK